MTIACCYVSPEGVIFGADSTLSYGLETGNHYLDHAQKIYEIGTDSSLAAIFWGVAGLGTISFRTLLAILGDSLELDPADSVEDAARRWASFFHPIYRDAIAELYPEEVELCRALAARPPAGSGGENERTEDEEDIFSRLQDGLATGFCIGGRVPSDRTPSACVMLFRPGDDNPPALDRIEVNGYRFSGAPNMILRLTRGIDHATRFSILSSEHWTGTAAELDAVLAPHALGQVIMPLRDAIDFVHSCIQTTIKALKFSHFSQICGGPIELAVISTDRQFRWVRHKSWDAAVVDGDIS